jgi:hypothetical protein
MKNVNQLFIILGLSGEIWIRNSWLHLFDFTICSVFGSLALLGSETGFLPTTEKVQIELWSEGFNLKLQSNLLSQHNSPQWNHCGKRN